MSDALEEMEVRLDAVVDSVDVDENLWQLYWFFLTGGSTELRRRLVEYARDYSGFPEELGKFAASDAIEHMVLDINWWIDGDLPQRTRWNLADGSWGAAFGVAMRDSIAAVMPDEGRVSLEPFSPVHVAELLGSSLGENDVRNWIAAGRLLDGRWFVVSSGCDLTGWGREDWGYARVASTMENLLVLGLDEDMLDRLRISIELPMGETADEENDGMET